MRGLRGGGILTIEMHFLPDIYVPCDVCKGKRYNRETLEVKYKDKNISDVLDMTVEEACVFFANIPKIARKLQTLQEVGLGYIQLGQAATTLSGGEASASSLPMSWPAVIPARPSIFWTSPPLVCMWRMFTALSRCWISWSMQATQSS